MKPATIIFDFFGVFVPDIYNEWSAHALPSDQSKQIREDVMGKVDLNQISRDDFFDLLSEVAGKERAQVEEEWMRHIVLNDSLVELVKPLKDQYTVVLCSNAATWEIRPILEQFGLLSLFDQVFISAEVQLVKPDADFFEHVLTSLAIAPGDALFVDDNSDNISAAQSFGILSTQFVGVKQLQAELQKRSIL